MSISILSIACLLSTTFALAPCSERNSLAELESPKASALSFASRERGKRYGELLLVFREGQTFTAEVWGTPGLNDCPQASWDALDTRKIKRELGAFAVIKNGPRFFLPNRIEGQLPSTKVRTFGDIEMRRLATLEINLRSGKAPYTERVVQRKTKFVFDQGEEIYELVSPNGDVYVMQSMSQIVDEELDFDDLKRLSNRLRMPRGWNYRSRFLEEDLILIADGNATVIQDDLKNTYQKR